MSEWQTINQCMKEQDHSSQILGRQQALQIAAGGGVTEDLRPLVWPRLDRETTFDLKPERVSTESLFQTDGSGCHGRKCLTYGIVSKGDVVQHHPLRTSTQIKQGPGLHHRRSE